MYIELSLSSPMAATTNTCLYFSSSSFTQKYTNLPLYPSLLPSSSSSNPRSSKLLYCLSINPQNDRATTTAPISADIPNSAAVESLRVVFAAGGTGGHIYPAVAIADELNCHHPNTQTLFIGAPNSTESTAIPSAGYDFAAVFATPLFRPFLSLNNLTLPYHLIKSIFACYTILKEFNPDIVIGTGGYVSFPVCLAALLIPKTKVAIQEQNSVPGIANWVLSFFADIIFVAFNSSIDCFPRKGRKFLVCGNPVRLSLRRYVSKAVARLQFFAQSSEESKVVLVLGGSLGAHAVNIALLFLYYDLLLEHKNWYIIWQTGVEAYDEMESLVKNHQNVLLTPFLHSMDLAYAAADLVVSRAGAMTCSEILATGKPSILIPSPNVAEGHQFKNASLMADVAGSKVINEDELDSTTLRCAIEEILGNEALMAEMSERALRAAKPDASAEIAQHILSLVNLPTSKK